MSSTATAATARGGTKGKQRIPIKKIEDEDARYISFSKRRTGVFVKASDLSTLCGNDVVVIVFSPTGRPHTFGSPAVEQLVDRYIAICAGESPSEPSRHERAYWKQVAQNLSQEVMVAAEAADAARAKRAELLQRYEMSSRGMGWVEKLDDMGAMEVERVAELFEVLKMRVDGRMSEFLQRGAVPAFPGGSDAGVGGGSADRGAECMLPAGGGWPPAPAPVQNPQRYLDANPVMLMNPYEEASAAVEATGGAVQPNDGFNYHQFV